MLCCLFIQMGQGVNIHFSSGANRKKGKSIPEWAGLVKSCLNNWHQYVYFCYLWVSWSLFPANSEGPL